MKRSGRTFVRHGMVALACVLAPAFAHADTVASLLGNFTINQATTLRLADDAVTAHYAVVFGQLPALRELHAADSDGDGVTTQAERDAYARTLAPAIADNLKLTIAGVAVPLMATGWTTSLPTEQGGFSLRIDVDVAGMLPAGAGSPRALQFANQNHAGRFGWNEITVQAASRWHVYATNAYNVSPTASLTEALTVLPASGPLDERGVQLQFTDGAVPAGAVALGPRGTGIGDAPVAPGATALPEIDGGWLQVQTRRLIELVSARDVPVSVALLALLAAMVLGALHAFSPGHGKTVVGAYLIGSRGTPRHAVFLGIAVTVTHTLGVFALGFATLFASRYVMPEKLLPALSLVSGLLVLGMGAYLLRERWPGAAAVLQHRWRALGASTAGAPRPLAFRSLATAPAGGGYVAARVSHGHAHGDGHAHEHGHSHDHDHAHDAEGHDLAHGPGAHLHSHGGRVHSHVPPAGAAITWRSLLALGVSGGLVPCPSALVLLLAAVALNKTAYGLLLVVAFSAGLALTLTAVGLAFLYARNRLRSPAAGSAWVQVLPVLSALAITLVGVVLCYGALTGVSL